MPKKCNCSEIITGLKMPEFWQYLIHLIMCWYKQFSWWSCSILQFESSNFHILKNKSERSLLKEWCDATKLEHFMVNKHCLQEDEFYKNNFREKLTSSVILPSYSSLFFRLERLIWIALAVEWNILSGLFCHLSVRLTFSSPTGSGTRRPFGPYKVKSARLVE